MGIFSRIADSLGLLSASQDVTAANLQRIERHLSRGAAYEDTRD